MTAYKVEEVRYVCDFCRYFHDESYSIVHNKPSITRPEAYAWFIVSGNLHACKDCGHKLHFILDTLNIKHTFECTEYGTKETGKIDLDCD